MKIKESNAYRAFTVCNTIFMVFLMVIMLYPMLYVLFASLSDADVLMTTKGFLLRPAGFSLSAYKATFQNPMLLSGYINTIIIVLAGVAVNLIMTAIGAYFLSRRGVMLQKYVMMMIIFTMFFGGGLIPTYLNMKNLHLLDNRWGIVIGFAVSAFYVILMRSFFEGVPEALEESAKLDGADDIRIMWQIYMPLSTPALMTIMLYYAIDRWNGYFWTMILIKDESKISLQVLLTKLIITLQGYEETMGMIDTAAYSNQTLVYATIVVSVVPILLVYPYIQKYFVSGMTLGAVKG